MLGKTVSHYEVLEQLGGGGMGVVYKARDTRLGRTVALKFLSPELAGSAAHKERFLREARAASALDHPHICSIYDLGETADGGLFIAMAFCPGETLKERIARGPVPAEEALSIALQIAEGLAAAHAQGIVHRDVKPGNVVVGEDGAVKLVDFGLAKLAGDSDLTRSGTVVGTAAYMSPEQVMGDAIDRRTDLWSLGVLLYEMVAGDRPFRGERDQAVMHAIVTREPPPPPLPAAESALLLPLLGRLLAKRPEERYGSGEELIADLRALLGLPPPSGTARTLQLSSPGLPASDPTRPSRPPASRAGGTRGALPTPATGPARLLGALSRRQRRALSAGAGLAVALAVVLAVVLAIWALRNRREEATPGPLLPALPASKVLAVLPFDDLSGRPGGQLLCDGFAETVSARLAAARGVQVVPPSAAGGAEPSDPLRAARALGANLVLRGSVQRSRDQVRITYSLLHAERGLQVAGDSLTGPDADLFSIQDRLAESVLAALAVAGGPRPAGPAAAALPAGDQQARYLRAAGHLRRYDREESVDEAMGLLEALAAEAPDSAAVQAALGRAYLHKHNLTREPRWVDLAVEACARARRLDPDPEVDVTLGTLHTRTGAPREAIAAFERALAAQPEHFEALLGLARARDAAGEAQLAEATYRRAIALRPRSWEGYSKLGGFHFGRGRYERAAAMFRRATELAPDNARAFSNLGAAFQLQGDLERALAAFRRSVELAPTALAYSNLGTAEFYLGHTAPAATAFEHAVELTPGYHYYWANLGDAYRWTAGLEAKARAAYARAIELARGELDVNPREGTAHSVLALCLAKTGRLDEAGTHAREALAASPDNPETLYDAALVAHLAGKRAEALALLDRAARAGYNRAFLAADPELAGLAREEAFRRLVRGYDRGTF